MNKILIVADIHIYDYPDRNPSVKYRLHQSRLVAQNIINTGKQEGCDYIAFAGDIIERSEARPYIQAETKYFLDTVMSNFKYGFIIWGNHDQDNKSDHQEFIDSWLSVMLPKNLYYMDRKETKLGNTTIAFSNWRPLEIDLSWLDHKVDVLVTHADIAYSASDCRQTEKIDDTKFNLAICGHIHRAAQVGKYVSIGCAQKCKMGDSDDATGVIYDLDQKKWKWVNLNQSGNLIKLAYTSVKKQEGWDGKTGTWYVYKSDILNKIDNNQKLPGFSGQIDSFISGAIKANNLEQVHTVVLNNVRDTGDVDFDFTLTRLHCKNWRSIGELTLDLAEGDKILILGDNGSGKSSILSAIHYAFIPNKHPKELIKNGENECMTEVEFVYQGQDIILMRGCKMTSKKTSTALYGLQIDGQIQKYNNLSEFNKDVLKRFPFIDYLEELNIFDSNHLRFIAGFGNRPEEKTRLISKLFGLGKIDTYNQIASQLLDVLNNSMFDKNQEIEKDKKIISFANEKLSLIKVPEVGYHNLLIKQQQGYKLQKQYYAYTTYIRNTANLQAGKTQTENSIKDLESKISGFRDQSIIQNQISNLQGQVSEIMSRSRELDQVRDTGRKVYLENEELKKTKVCPRCGQVIKDTDSLKKHRAELEKEISELLGKQKKLLEYFKTAYGLDKSDINSGKLQEIISGFNQKIAELMSELNNQEQTKLQLDNLKVQLSNYENQIKQVGQAPEKVDLPSDFMIQMSKIDSDLATWKQYNEYLKMKQDAIQEMNKYISDLTSSKNQALQLQTYIKLTGPTGDIYEKIMQYFATEFSDNTVKYKVHSYKTNGKYEHLDLESVFVGHGYEVTYDNCSDGQKTILDVDYIRKITHRIGFLILDEFFNNLDSKNNDIYIDMVNQINMGCLFITSHKDSIPAFYNKTMRVSFDNNTSTTNVIFE